MLSVEKGTDISKKYSLVNLINEPHHNTLLLALPNNCDKTVNEVEVVILYADKFRYPQTTVQ